MTARLLARATKHDELMATQEWDGHGRKADRSWRFLTLTMPIPICEDPDTTWSSSVLRRRIQLAMRSWSKFWRMTNWGRQVHGEEGRKRSRRDTSAIRAIEVAPSGGMVHVHALVYGEFISQAQLQAMWGKALGERLAIVDVRGLTSLEEGLKEVFKYVTKGTGDRLLPARRAAHVELAFRQVHRISMSGRIRRVKLTPWDGAHEDIRAEDVHDHKVAACEGCGTVGDWRWLGPIDPAGVRFNGGFGLFRRQRHFEDVLRESAVARAAGDCWSASPGADQSQGAGVCP